MPVLPGQSSRLVSITAVSSRDVWAAGYYQGDSPYGLPAGPLILHWDGTRWSVVQGIATLDRLTSIAAASSRDVWAVAGDVAEHWDRTQWHTTSVPAGGLTALAVAAPDDIWGLDSQLDRYAGPLCYTAQAAPHAIPIAHTGLQNTGMAATPDAPGALVVDGARHRAFVRNATGTVSTLDTQHSTLVRQVDLAASGGLALDAPVGRVFVPSTRGSTGGSVQVLDATTGSPVGAFATGPSPTALAYDQSRGRLLVAEADGVRLLSAAGDTVATVPMSAPVTLAVDTSTGRAFVSNAEVQYPEPNIATDATSLVVLDTSTGAVISRLPGIGGQLAVDELTGQVLVGYATEQPDLGFTVHVSVLDATSGRLVHTYDLGSNSDAFLGTMALDAPTGQLYIASYFGLQALDVASGRLRTLVGQDFAGSAIAVDAVRNRVLATSVYATNQYGEPVSPGTLTVFDGVSGACLAVDVVGQGPDVVAADQTSGQTYVVDDNGRRDDRRGLRHDGESAAADTGRPGRSRSRRSLLPPDTPQPERSVPGLLAAERRTRRVRLSARRTLCPGCPLVPGDRALPATGRRRPGAPCRARPAADRLARFPAGAAVRLHAGSPVLPEHPA